jgi:hypothetical protein
MCSDTNWLSYNTSCYYISPLFGADSSLSWFAARRYCQNNNADLASILSEDENSFLNSYVSCDVICHLLSQLLRK